MAINKTQIKFHRIEGKSFFAKVHKPEKNVFNNDKMEFSIGILFDSENDPVKLELEKLLKANKCKKSIYATKDPKTKLEDGKMAFNFNTRAWFDEAGTLLNPLIVVDKFNRPILPTTLIGNGSDVIIEYFFRPAKDENGTLTGKSVVELHGVMVKNLVHYEAKPLSQVNNFKPLEELPEDESQFDSAMPF
jgi:hypothetical protein